MSIIGYLYNIFSIVVLGDYVPVDGALLQEDSTVYDWAYNLAYYVTGSITPPELR